MKKIVLAISAYLLLSNFVIAQQDSTALMQTGKSMQPKHKNYADSSSKYYRYGGDTTHNNYNKSRGSKNRNKRDKTDSINPTSKQ